MEIAWGDASCPDRNRAMLEWAGAMLGHPLAEPCTTMGVIDGDGLVAVVVFHNFSRRAGIIELSAASTTPRWLTRPVLRAMFGYPFRQIGTQLVVLRVSERNERMIGIALRFGFTGHRIPRLRGPDEAEIILTLTVEDWQANGFFGR